MAEQLFWIGALIFVCWLVAKLLARGSHSDAGCGCAEQPQPPQGELVQIRRRSKEEN